MPTDYTPELHMVESRRNDRLGWPAALAELIDNSFDAGATRVEIEFSRRSMTVRDDGSGTSDVTMMIRFGGHKKHRTTSLGTYGVGLKDAWLWLSNRITIDTRHAGQRQTLDLDYAKDLDDKWIGPDPITEASEGPSGTTITFQPLHSNRTAPKEETYRSLGLTFMPALLEGKQIVVVSGNKRKPIRAYQLPASSDVVEAEFAVHGRTVKIKIGIANEGVKIDKPGFCLCYGHRVIKPFTTIGTGNYSSQRMVGTIVLGSGWKLTPHKDDLSDLDEDLADAIFSRIEPLLQQAEQLSEDIESNQLRHELEESLNIALQSAKAREQRNGKERETGTIPSVNTGRKRRRAEKFNILEPGSVEVTGDGLTKRRRGIKLDWCEIDSDQIGLCDQLTNTVFLNVTNSFIAHAKDQDNKEALRAVAISLLCHDYATHEGKQPFIFEKRDFISSWGLVMSSLKFKDSKNAK